MINNINETTILNFSDSSIQELIHRKGWHKLNETEKIKSIYNFVRDEIVFGYNRNDNITASQVLKDKYGQCNTKSTLFMALLMAVEIPCRFHAFAIDKKLQKGAITGFYYFLTPKEIIHSWVEVFYNGNWINMEGFILDKPYLNNLQKIFPQYKTSFCGYGVATNNFKNPPIEWNGGDTYIQKEGIVKDFGIYDSPDQFYKKNGSNLSGFKQFIFEHKVRKVMNENVNKIRTRNRLQ